VRACGAYTAVATLLAATPPIDSESDRLAPWEALRQRLHPAIEHGGAPSLTQASPMRRELRWFPSGIFVIISLNTEPIFHNSFSRIPSSLVRFPFLDSHTSLSYLAYISLNSQPTFPQLVWSAWRTQLVCSVFSSFPVSAVWHCSVRLRRLPSQYFWTSTSVLLLVPTKSVSCCKRYVCQPLCLLSCNMYVWTDCLPCFLTSANPACPACFFDDTRPCSSVTCLTQQCSLLA
jgi:hypothetical protein